MKTYFNLSDSMMMYSNYAIWIIHNISSVHIITVVILGIIHMAERFMSVVPTNWNAPLSRKQSKYSTMHY